MAATRREANGAARRAGRGRPPASGHLTRCLPARPARQVARIARQSDGAAKVPRVERPARAPLAFDGLLEEPAGAVASVVGHGLARSCDRRVGPVEQARDAVGVQAPSQGIQDAAREVAGLPRAIHGGSDAPGVQVPAGLALERTGAVQSPPQRFVGTRLVGDAPRLGDQLVGAFEVALGTLGRVGPVAASRRRDDPPPPRASRPRRR